VDLASRVEDILDGAQKWWSVKSGWNKKRIHGNIEEYRKECCDMCCVMILWWEQCWKVDYQERKNEGDQKNATELATGDKW